MPAALSRRAFLNRVTAASAGSVFASSGLASSAADRAAAIKIDPTPRFELSPYLYMQFMEPLGATDGSVAAAWDYRRHNWRRDLVEATRELAPPLMRWGGCFSSYYRWKEAVGPLTQRTPMQNLLWGGTEDNRVGTVEFVDFCRQVGADPLMCVNFESDGRKPWMTDADGRSRVGTAAEAAEWVA